MFFTSVLSSNKFIIFQCHSFYTYFLEFGIFCLNCSNNKTLAGVGGISAIYKLIRRHEHAMAISLKIQTELIAFTDFKQLPMGSAQFKSGTFMYSHHSYPLSSAGQLNRLLLFSSPPPQKKRYLSQYQTHRKKSTDWYICVCDCIRTSALLMCMCLWQLSPITHNHTHIYKWNKHYPITFSVSIDRCALIYTREKGRKWTINPGYVWRLPFQSFMNYNGQIYCTHSQTQMHMENRRYNRRPSMTEEENREIWIDWGRKKI